MLKPLSLNWLYVFTIFGFSRLQGPHQLAQKSTKTYLPRNADKLSLSPAGVNCWMSGAIMPTATDLYTSIIFLISIPLAEDFKLSSSILNKGSTSSASE